MDEGDKSKYELDLWGIKELLHNLANILTMIVLGVIIGKMTECIIFYISYSVLRSFAGGYHANTRLKCYLFSTMMLAVFILTVGTLAEHIAFANVIIVVAAAVILMLAPVDNNNKLLYDKEKITFKRITVAAMLVEIVIYIIVYIFKWNIPAACMAESMMWVSIMVVLGELKLRVKRT